MNMLLISLYYLRVCLTPGIEAVSDTRPAAVKTAVARRGLSSLTPPTPPPRTPLFTMESRCQENPHQQQIKEMTRRYFPWKCALQFAQNYANRLLNCEGMQAVSDFFLSFKVTQKAQ